MYKVITESIECEPTQFNTGRRGIQVRHGNPGSRQDGDSAPGDLIYATVYLPAEGRWWEGQRGINVEVFVRPSLPVRILVSPPKTEWGDTYGSDNHAKTKAMQSALNELCEQVDQWIHSFVYTKNPTER